MRKIFLLFPLFVFFSVNIFANSFISGVGVHQFKNIEENKIQPLVISTGFNSVRVDYLWRAAEEKKGVYKNDTAIDSLLDKLNSESVGAIIILGKGNPIYLNGHPVSKNEIKSFVDYSKWLAHKFRGRGYIYEVWNEWSLNVGHSSLSAIQYYHLVKSVSGNIKKIDPTAKIIAGGFNPERSDEVDWGMKIISLGILNYIDGLSLHPYLYEDNFNQPVSDNLLKIKILNEKIKRIINSDKEIPMYITEVGLPTHAYFHGMHFDDDYIGNYAKDYFKKARGFNFIKGVWWYDLIDDGVSEVNPEFNYGLYDNYLKIKKSGKILSGYLNG